MKLFPAIQARDGNQPSNKPGEALPPARHVLSVDPNVDGSQYILSRATGSLHAEAPSEMDLVAQI